MRTLDHLYSRKLKGIKTSKDGSWSLMLDGDAVIANHDKRFKIPDIPKNLFGKLTFTVSILEEEKTTLVFQNDDRSQEWRIILNPMKYSIKMPDEEEVFPQRGMPLAYDIPAHPDERIADGPTGEEEE